LFSERGGGGEQGPEFPAVKRAGKAPVKLTRGATTEERTGS